MCTSLAIIIPFVQFSSLNLKRFGHGHCLRRTHACKKEKLKATILVLGLLQVVGTVIIISHSSDSQITIML